MKTMLKKKARLVRSHRPRKALSKIIHGALTIGKARTNFAYAPPRKATSSPRQLFVKKINKIFNIKSS
jgi:hypothetical protein